MGKAVPYFATVGAILGAAQGGIYVGVHGLSTPLLAAVLATATLALITGAFHHDGLADMADAFGGGWSPEQRLEIMKDSTLGTYGVTALVFVIAAEVAALSALAGWQAFAAAVAAHAISRSAASLVMVWAPPARAAGLGVDYLAQLSRPAVFASALVVVVATAVVFQLTAVAIAVGVALTTLAVVKLAVAKIGGISGDVLGAVQQLTKIAVLAAIVLTS